MWVWVVSADDVESDVSTPLNLATRHMTINEIETDTWESPQDGLEVGAGGRKDGVAGAFNRGLTDAAGRKLSPGGLNRKGVELEASGPTGLGGSKGILICSELSAVRESRSGEYSEGGKGSGGKNREVAAGVTARKNPGCGCVIM